ncbi:MAG: histidine phosphatase family protein [archaeon]
MKVIFLRHGQAEHNVHNEINQDPNIPVHLTPKGKKQAVEAKKKLGEIEFDVVFVSDFIRTQETAEIVSKDWGVPIFVDERISEAKTGFEGKSAVEYNLDSAHDFYNFKVKGRESWNDVVKRVKNFLKDLKKEKYENVLVVTHGWVLQIADEIANGIKDEEARWEEFRNCEFLEFEI